VIPRLTISLQLVFERIIPPIPRLLCLQALILRQHPGKLWNGHVSVVAMDIGQKVRVRRLRDRVPPQVVKKLGQVGVVRDFKVVDGKGVGLLIQFDDQFATWFFEDELEQYS
jgi:hypothetical protein